MKTKNLLLITTWSLCFFTSILFAQSPDWLWAKGIRGTYQDYGQSIATDASGNVYTTGNFSGTADFDPGAGISNLTSASGYPDIFISKIDALGNFVWAKAIGAGGSSDDEGMCIAIDASGNVYSTGIFGGTVDFDPGAGVKNLIGGGYQNVFISKLDASGNFVWAKAMDVTAGYAHGLSIALDASGNVYTTGYFGGTVDFNPGAAVFNLTAVGQDMFICKLDGSGNFLWTKAMGGGTATNGFSIALDASGNSYTTGCFNGTADFDPGSGTFNLTSAGNLDIFICKLDGSGNFVWAKAIGGTGDDLGFSISIDPVGSGNIYTTGYFKQTADFDPGTGTFNLSSVAYADVFISKLDGSGNFLWAKGFGSTDEDKSFAIALDATGNVYTTGSFAATVDFDPGAGIFNLTAGYYDAFISKLDGSGNFVWAKAIGGTGWDAGNSIALDVLGNVNVTGWFRSSSVIFGPTTITKSNDTEIFIAKLDNTITGIETAANNDGISFYPNPVSNSTTISFSLYQSQKVSLKIFDLNGRLIKALVDGEMKEGEHHLEWNATEVNAGVYFLRMQTGETLQMEKLVVAK